MLHQCERPNHSSGGLANLRRIVKERGHPYLCIPWYEPQLGRHGDGMFFGTQYSLVNLLWELLISFQTLRPRSPAVGQAFPRPSWRSLVVTAVTQ